MTLEPHRELVATDETVRTGEVFPITGGNLTTGVAGPVVVDI